jgi:4-aminobutyrate aminotransferase
LVTTKAPSTLTDVWYRMTQLEVVSGRGCVITSADGTEYLDFGSGIGVVSTGHCHPRIVEAIREQAGTLLHAQVNCYRHPLLEPLAAALAEVTPAGVDAFFISNSGAEAIEAAVKLARHATGRPNVIAFQGGFHGRTAVAMAMTSSKVSYRTGYAPLPAGIHIAPYPLWFHFREDPEAASQRCLRELEFMLSTQTAPADTAAVVIEPILGEGGYVVPPASFLQGVEAICREHDILLVVDEIQTGFGRTGEWFAVEHFGVRPDVLVMAKGIASGFPLSAVGARQELMSRWVIGSHGGTYGGNPIGCAAALATIETLREERLVENAAARGDQLLTGLRELQRRHPAVGDVRGLGSMIGVEFVDADGQPDPARVSGVLSHCLREGRLILLSCGPFGNVIRFVPPLVVSEREAEIGLAAFAAALDATE